MDSFFLFGRNKIARRVGDAYIPNHPIQVPMPLELTLGEPG